MFVSTRLVSKRHGKNKRYAQNDIEQKNRKINKLIQVLNQENRNDMELTRQVADQTS